jgi:hypothetical protein
MHPTGDRAQDMFDVNAGHVVGLPDKVRGTNVRRRKKAADCVSLHTPTGLIVAVMAGSSRA